MKDENTCRSCEQGGKKLVCTAGAECVAMSNPEYESWLQISAGAADSHAAAPLADLRRLIADDAYAMTFQTFGQYRTALLKAIDAVSPRGLSASDGQTLPQQPTPSPIEQEPVAHLYRDHAGQLKLAQTSPPPTGAFPVYATPTARRAVQGQAAPEARMLTEDEKDAMQLARDALEMARTGLDWYRGLMPEYVDGSDNEADDEINAALAAIDAAMSGAKAGDKQ